MDRKTKGKLDVVVGMQFGDEGKGSTCVMLEEALKGRNEHKYLFSVRVGGSQAEHRYVYQGKNYRFRVLPSLGAVPDIDLLLGAGHIIRKDILTHEMHSYDIYQERIFIDKQAAVVSNESIGKSLRNASQGRGGYAMGTSSALCEKMKRKDPSSVVFGQLHRFGNVGTVVEMVNDRLSVGQNGLLEGTQGAMLSLNHGYFPFVTSYDVTTPALLGMAGLHWDDVRDVYGVFKVFPTRVAGASGIMAGMDLTWREVREQSPVDIPLGRTQQTHMDGSFAGEEKVAKIHQGETRRALLLNRPTKLVLTHTDWCPEDTIKRIVNMLEATAKETLGRECPVVFLRHGEDIDDYSVR